MKIESIDSDGYVTLPDAPGLGVGIDGGAIEPLRAG